MLWYKTVCSSSFYRPLVGLIGMVFGLSGCGFTPQFAYSPTGTSLFSEIEIPSIPDRQGLILRNHLLNRLPSSPAPRYSFQITLATSQRDVGTARDSTSSREQTTTTAMYQLIEKKTRRLVGKGSCQASAYFNVSKHQVFQTTSSEKTASTQTLFQLRDCLISRVSLLLQKDASHEKP